MYSIQGTYIKIEETRKLTGYNVSWHTADPDSLKYSPVSSLCWILLPGMVEPSLTENKNEDLPDFERIPLLSAKSPCSDNATHNEDNKTTETNLEDGCHQQEPSHPHRGRLVRQEADAVPPVNVVANGESFTDDPKDHTDVWGPCWLRWMVDSQSCFWSNLLTTFQVIQIWEQNLSWNHLMYLTL